MVWFYPFPYFQKPEHFTPVHLRCSFICFKALSLCARLYAHACTAICTHANNVPTLLQPKLCCPFILQVMTKINCELHSTCTEFTVQMNSNEEYIEIQQLLSGFLAVFALFRYFLSNIAEAISLILASS